MIKITTPHHNRFMALFLGPPGWAGARIEGCKGRLTEADTLTILLGATPSGLTSAHLHHPPFFLQAGCPSCRPTNKSANRVDFFLVCLWWFFCILPSSPSIDNIWAMVIVQKIRGQTIRTVLYYTQWTIKKRGSLFLTITSANLNRFLKIVFISF